MGLEKGAQGIDHGIELPARQVVFQINRRASGNVDCPKAESQNDYPEPQGFHVGYNSVLLGLGVEGLGSRV